MSTYLFCSGCMIASWVVVHVLMPWGAKKKSMYWRSPKCKNADIREKNIRNQNYKLVVITIHENRSNKKIALCNQLQRRGFWTIVDTFKTSTQRIIHFDFNETFINWKMKYTKMLWRWWVKAMVYLTIERGKGRLRRIIWN